MAFVFVVIVVLLKWVSRAVNSVSLERVSAP
jgi:hypothetical protein